MDSTRLAGAANVDGFLALQAEVKALAKRMLRKRSRDELLEGAYNKYAFHDAGLPRWFAEDQRRHARCAWQPLLLVLSVRKLTAWPCALYQRWWSSCT